MIKRYALGAAAVGVLAVGGLAGFTASANASPGTGPSEVRVVQPAAGEQEGTDRGTGGRDGRDCPDKDGSGGSGGSGGSQPEGSSPAPSQSSGTEDAAQL